MRNFNHAGILSTKTHYIKLFYGLVLFPVVVEVSYKDLRKTSPFLLRHLSNSVYTVKLKLKEGCLIFDVTQCDISTRKY